MKIWLDDVRTPPDQTWIWCRNSEDFLAITKYPPCIEHVAFDHDLGEDSLNGSELAGMLAERCIEFDYCPSFSCHSDNPDGKKNILSKMESLQRFLSIIP